MKAGGLLLIFIGRVNDWRFELSTGLSESVGALVTNINIKLTGPLGMPHVRSVVLSCDIFSLSC